VNKIYTAPLAAQGVGGEATLANSTVQKKEEKPLPSRIIEEVQTAS